MARKLRIQYADAMFHVMSRGGQGEDIFLDDLDPRGPTRAFQQRTAAVKWGHRPQAGQSPGLRPASGTQNERRL